MSLSNEQQFLRELTKLSKKHGLYVGGCDCFGSPFLFGRDGKVIVEDVRQVNVFDKDGPGPYVGLDKETKKTIR